MRSLASVTEEESEVMFTFPNILNVVGRAI
jgi:hypothetical protein